MIAVLVPVLRRPHRVRTLMDNLASATTLPCRLLFIASPNDEAEIAELQAQGADHIVMDRAYSAGDYARKINAGFVATSEPFVFTGADDLHFHRGWDIAALEAAAEERIGVVGTQDLCNQRVLKGLHSTHSLVRRSYVERFGVVDAPGKVLCEKYPHEFCDDELVATAKQRGAWAFAGTSWVEHMHPDCGKSETDDIYASARKRLMEGRRIFQMRQRLWKRLEPTVEVPFAVIVATYGDESWKATAERAVTSVGVQTAKAAEVVTYHGSTLAEARNTGAEQTSAPWLVFLDADDELHPRFLAEMHRMAGDDDGLLNPAVQFVMLGGRAKPPRCFPGRDLAKGNYLVIGTAVRREFFFAAGGFDEQWEAWEDWALWRRVVALGATIKRVPKAVYRAHWRAEGRNNTVPDKDGLTARIHADFDQWSRVRA